MGRRKQGEIKDTGKRGKRQYNKLPEKEEDEIQTKTRKVILGDFSVYFIVTGMKKRKMNADLAESVSRKLECLPVASMIIGN